MYARSTSIQARAESMDAGIRLVRSEVLPAVQHMPGCIGLSMMADRESGRCIVTSAWDSMNTMRASDPAVAPLREKGGKLFGGLPFVEEWEIALLHRDHHSPDGACVRGTWMKGDPAAMNHGIEVFKMVILLALKAVEGFCSASMFVDRAAGRVVTSVAYDTRQAMIASRDTAMRLRRAAVADAGGDILDVAEFDVLAAHLRVPEMA